MFCRGVVQSSRQLAGAVLRNSPTRPAHALRVACATRAYSSEFGSYEVPHDFSKGEETVRKKPRAYRNVVTRERPSVLTSEDRRLFEYKKQIREGKNVDQYNDTLRDYFAREDSYEVLVTLMEMYTTKHFPTVSTFRDILIPGFFKLNMPHKAVDLFIDLAPLQMKIDTSVYKMLAFHLVKITELSLLQRLRFLVEADGDCKKNQMTGIDVARYSYDISKVLFPKLSDEEREKYKLGKNIPNEGPPEEEEEGEPAKQPETSKAEVVEPKKRTRRSKSVQ